MIRRTSEAWRFNIYDQVLGWRSMEAVWVNEMTLQWMCASIESKDLNLSIDQHDELNHLNDARKLCWSGFMNTYRQLSSCGHDAKSSSVMVDRGRRTEGTQSRRWSLRSGLVHLQTLCLLQRERIHLSVNKCRSIKTIHSRQVHLPLKLTYDERIMNRQRWFA